MADTVLTKAVDLARAAAEEEAPWGTVGDHVGMDDDDERVATHYFACLDPAYVGWRWSVTVARAPRAKAATIDEVVLLPGPDALVAPAWVPWAERVRPGDLAVGTIWPTPVDDQRLTAGLTGLDELEGAADRSPVHPSQWEIGLGRPRVLSAYGRDEAADRWWSGDRGPEAPMARSVSLTCSSCGFLMPIGGPLGQAFGVCAHDMSPADGCVVALSFGCGAHSEIALAEKEPVSAPTQDFVGFDPLDLSQAEEESAEVVLSEGEAASASVTALAEADVLESGADVAEEIEADEIEADVAVAMEDVDVAEISADGDDQD
jgi:hypothetical protein